MDSGSLPDGGCLFQPGMSDPSVASCCAASPPPVGVCCQATDCAAGQRCLHHACETVTCAAVQDGRYYVDPLAGTNDPSSTGAMNCPVRTLARAFAILDASRRAAAGARATIAIVNDGVAPIVGAASGEVFPIQPPANVTINALDPTKNLPIVLNVRAPLPPGYPPYNSSFVMAQPGVVISSLVIEGNFETNGIYPGPDTSIDHVTLRNLSMGIEVEETLFEDGGGGTYFSTTIGPGVVVQGCEYGLWAMGRNTITIRGGRGRDHTSFSGNAYGIFIRDNNSLNIDGAGIDPAHPDESDVDTDSNSQAGLAMAVYGLSNHLPCSVRGLHSSHNPIGAWLGACDHLKMRGSYLGDNQQAGVSISTAAAGESCAQILPPWPLDLGNLAAGDPGRNIFQAASGTDAGSSICIRVRTGTVLATGNIFGTVDCAAPGTITWSDNCSSGADVGGLTKAIDISNCHP
jgi:hypothetical protein